MPKHFINFRLCKPLQTLIRPAKLLSKISFHRLFFTLAQAESRASGISELCGDPLGGASIFERRETPVERRKIDQTRKHFLENPKKIKKIYPFPHKHLQILTIRKSTNFRPNAHARPTKGNVFRLHPCPRMFLSGIQFFRKRNANPLGEQPMNYCQPAIVALRATYLPAYKAADIYVPISIYVPIRHYICRESSTNSPLFMQNKPNLLNTQMNISPVKTMNYEQLTMNYANKNKPNSKPIKPNTNPKQTQNKPNSLDAQMNVSLAITRNYNNEQRTMNNEPLFKTNPIPVFTPKTQYSLRKKTKKSVIFPNSRKFQFTTLLIWGKNLLAMM